MSDSDCAASIRQRVLESAAWRMDDEMLERKPHIAVSAYLNGALLKRVMVHDPVHHTHVRIHWWDAVKCLLRRGHITVSVTVDPPSDMVGKIMRACRDLA